MHKAKGDWDRALADYDEAIKREPKNAVVRNNRGLAFHAKGDFDRAISDFSEAIKLDAKYAAAVLNRANAWRGKHDLNQAKEDLEAALKLNPQLAAAQKGLDEVNRLLAKKAQAAPSAEQPSPAH